MRAQQRQIEDLLASQGWRIAERKSQPDWWLEEVWTIESVWSPVGDRAYVSFIVSPMAPIERAKGEHVWAVQVGRALATNAMGVNAVPLGPNWERKRVSEFTEHLLALRAGAAQ